MQNILIIPAILSAILLFSGCSAHRPEVQQGNVVTEEQLTKLEVGMEPRQVMFVLGSPLLRDPFHASRWDYYYRLEQDGEERAEYRATLYFEDNRLVRIERSQAIPANEREALELVKDRTRRN